LVVSHAVCVHVGGPKNFTDAGAHTPQFGAWLIPRNSYSCDCTEVGHSRPNHVGIG